MILQYIIGENVLSKIEKRRQEEPVKWRQNYRVTKEGDWKREEKELRNRGRKVID